MLAAILKMWPAMRAISPAVLALKDAKANATFLAEQKACDKLMQPCEFTRSVDGKTTTWTASLVRGVLISLEATRRFIKFHESRELGVLANVPSTLDRLLAELDPLREPCLSMHDDARTFAAQIGGRFKARYFDARPNRVVNGTVHAAQLFDAVTCGDLLEWFSPVTKAKRVAADPLAAVSAERVATARLIEARGTGEVLIDHFVYRVREKESLARAAAAALAMGAEPPEYVDEEMDMDLEAQERRITAQSAVLNAAVAAAPAPAAEADLSSRAFISTILEPALREASLRKDTNAAFWSRIEVERVRVRVGKAPDPHRVFWMAALATHNMLAAAASNSSEPERMNSILTALVTGKRNTLSPMRIVQLGWMRIVLRGKHARAPRWRRKRKAAALPAAAAAGAGAGAGAGPAGGGLAAIFKPTAAPADEFEVVVVEDDGVERDLLEVVLDAIVVGDDDEEELDLALELALAAEGDVADTDAVA